MPVRTVIQEFCDVCYVDDGAETEATDRLRFSWQGKDYLLLVCGAHVGPARDGFQRWSEMATETGSSTRSRGVRTPLSSASRASTLFSALDSEEKDRFRKWADLPTARRIGDARVQQWIDAGRP